LNSNFRIVEVKTQQDRSVVYQLRYKIFVEELGYQISGVTAETGLFEKADENCMLLLAYDGDTPAGTIAIDWWNEVEILAAEIEHFQLHSFAEAFSRDAIAIVRKALVVKPYRKTGLFMELLRASFTFMMSKPKIHFLFLDCSPYLVNHYEMLGCRRYAPHFYHDDTGILSVPMCLVLSDHVYLEQIGSRLLPVLKSYGGKHNADVRRYFQQNWTIQEDATQTDQEMPPFLQLPVEDLETLDIQNTPLFDGIGERGIRYLVSHCDRVAFDSGDSLVSSGDQSADIYVLTSGYVEVIVERGERKIAVATLGPGDLFGEISLLLKTGRSASVSALSTGECFRISEAVLNELLAGNAAVAAQIYLNLAKILAERLRTRSIWINRSPPL